MQGWINKLFKNYPDIETMATEKLKAFSTDLGTVIEKIQPMFENILSGGVKVHLFIPIQGGNDDADSSH